MSSRANSHVCMELQSSVSETVSVSIISPAHRMFLTMTSLMSSWNTDKTAWITLYICLPLTVQESCFQGSKLFTAGENKRIPYAIGPAMLTFIFWAKMSKRKSRSNVLHSCFVCWDSTFQGTSSFLILSNSLYINHPVMVRYRVWAIETDLNKPRTHTYIHTYTHTHTYTDTHTHTHIYTHIHTHTHTYTHTHTFTRTHTHTHTGKLQQLLSLYV
jgi:hypothetical protein